jgi:hypothetical protein
MHVVHFTLDLDRDELLRWYRGEAYAVVVRCEGGLKVQVPVHHLRPFVTVDGVQGRFALRFDPSGKLLSLRRAERASALRA